MQRRIVGAIAGLSLASACRLLFVLPTLILLPGLYAQEFRGTVTGRVVDAQAAAIPNAKIVAILVATGAQSVTNTGLDGQFTIPFLAPGSYRVEADAPGFKKYARENLGVSAGERIGIDIQLSLGQQTETITVSADAPMLDTTTATAGQVINSDQVENLPMNGRTPLVLAQLSFGVVPNSDPKFNRPFDNAGPSGFSMGGAPSQQNELLIDGAPDTTWDLRVAYNPPVDAVQEVRVHAFEADAAYGHTGGGTANVVLKSGTNAIHGSLYEFNQVSKLQATNFFTNKAGQKKPVGRYNQWGGTAGGPLWVPKVFNGKNKVFWFFAMEEINDSFPEPQTVMVPTADQRTGDLSNLLKVGGSYQIYDPSTAVLAAGHITRTGFPGNIIPTNRLSAIAKNYLQFYPQPNQPGNSDGTNNYLAGAVRKDTYNSELGRLDFNLGSSNRLFWNFRHNDRIENRNNLFQNPAEGRNLLRINYGSTLDDVHTFNATTVANVRLNFSRFREATIPFGDGFNGTSLGFPAYVAAAAPRLLLPLIRFNSTTAGQDYHQITSDSTSNHPFNIFSVFGDVVKVVGHHSLKFGADAREARDSNLSFGNSQGVYTFGTNWTKAADNSASASVGQDLAAFLLGMPTSGSLDINALRTNQTKYLAVFVQDDWRVRSNLSVNLGLRFEREFANTERYNRSISGFDGTTPSPISGPVQAAYALKPDVLPASQFKVLGGPLFATAANPNIFTPQSRMFSPRLGFAWTPLGVKTVIRGGTGVFMFPVNNPSFNQPGFSQSTTMLTTQDNYLTPYATLANPFPDGFQQPTGSSLGLATNLGKSLTYYNPTIRNAYSVRWEFGAQRELPGGVVLEMAYIGNHALHLLMDRNMDAVPAKYLSTSPTRDQATIDYLGFLVANPFAGQIPGQSLNSAMVSRQTLLTPFPQFTGLTLQGTNAASSFFHSLDARIEKRMSHGLSILANFTYSKLIARDNYKNATDTQPEKRVAADDRPLRLVISGSYTLPFGKGKAMDLRSGALNRIVGGWSLNGIYVNQIGAPLTFGSNIIFNGGTLNNNPHPGNLDSPMFDTTRFNTSSPQQLASNIATFGTRYGSLRQDGAANVDLSLIKNTSITEKVRIQLRFEAFNALNRPSFDPPNLSVTSSSFGKITTQPNLPRSIQMAARLTF